MLQRLTARGCPENSIQDSFLCQNLSMDDD